MYTENEFLYILLSFYKNAIKKNRSFFDRFIKFYLIKDKITIFRSTCHVSLQYTALL